MWLYIIISLSVWAGVVSSIVQHGFFVDLTQLLIWLATGSFVAAITLGGRPGWVTRLVAAVLLWTAALLLLLVGLHIEPLPLEPVVVLVAGHLGLTLAGLFLGALLRYRPRANRRRRTSSAPDARAADAPAASRGL